jgi:F0F1-type ATP synthase assembly protein I
MIDRSTLQLGMAAAGLVTTSSVAIALGALVGYGFDWYFHTSPWGLLVGVFLGFPLGMYRLAVGLRQLGVVEPAGDDPPA